MKYGKIFVVGLSAVVLVGVIYFLFTKNCSAMIFSQPVKIGTAGCPDQSPYAGVVIEGATFNNGNYWTQDDPNPNKGNRKTYSRGIARWGNDSDALYCKYDYESKILEYGGENVFVVSLDWSMREIKKISTNVGITLYSLYYSFKYSDYVIIGRRKDGSWVKFIDTKKINEQYFGKDLYWADAPRYKAEIHCQGDTIIIPCEFSKNHTNGEFRFKWNETEQWFDVEKIVY